MKHLKKLFILALLMCVGQTKAKDGDQITLEAGTANVFYTLQSAFFETDFSEANVGGKTWDEWLRSKGDDFVRDWPGDKQKIDNFFMTRFNKKTKKKGGLQLQNTNPDEPYSMVIHMKEIDMGSIGGGVVASVFLGAFAKKAGGVNLKSGYVDVTDRETGRIVCRLSFKDVRGDNSVSVTSMLMMVMEDMHDELIGFAERFGSQQRPEMEGMAVVGQEPAVQTTHAISLSPAPASQSGGGNATVKLRNGATLTGRLVKFDPLEEVVLEIAGKETAIPMSKVEKVETSESSRPATTTRTSTPTTAPRSVQPASQPNQRMGLGNRKMIETDESPYPETITLNVGDQMIKMVLVRGGHMNMGYDGDHSLSMNSEPVHEVEVTSFYISEGALTTGQMKGAGVKAKGKSGEMALMETWDDANKAAQTIARATGMKCRLPLECEWEYAACCTGQGRIFSDIANKKKESFDWCQDYYADFSDGNAVLTDPVGPIRGKEHVVRAYNAERGKFDRSNRVRFGKCDLGYVRLVVKAADTIR